MPNGVQFDVEEWIMFLRALAPADAIMRQLAAKHGFNFLTDIRGYWPARRLAKRRRCRTIEVQLSLDARYFEDKKIIFTLSRMLMFDCGWFWRKDLEYIKLAEYSPEQMEDHRMLEGVLEKQVLESISRLQRTP